MLTRAYPTIISAHRPVGLRSFGEEFGILFEINIREATDLRQGHYCWTFALPSRFSLRRTAFFAASLARAAVAICCCGVSWDRIGVAIMDQHRGSWWLEQSRLCGHRLDCSLILSDHLIQLSDIRIDRLCCLFVREVVCSAISSSLPAWGVPQNRLAFGAQTCFANLFQNRPLPILWKLIAYIPLVLSKFCGKLTEMTY